jgi:hypothetical protein
MISLKFWKNKSEAEIIANAKKEERELCEKHYLEELTAQRERFSEQTRIDEAKHLKVLADQRVIDEKIRHAEVKKVSDKAREIIKSLKTQIHEKNERIEETRKAWEMFKEFMPDAIRLSNILKIRAQISMDNSVEKYRDSSALEDNFESLGRKIRGITPHIEGLLVEPEDKKK